MSQKQPNPPPSEKRPPQMEKKMETCKINAVLLGVVRRGDRDMILIRIGDEVVECTPSYAAMVASHIDGLVSLFDDPEDVPVPGEGSVPPITQAQAH